VRALSGIAGLVAGGAALVLALRVRRDMAARGVSLTDALLALPAMVRRDLDEVRGDARLALEDGRRAADERRRMLEAQLAEF
jgi:hypothetical protein